LPRTPDFADLLPQWRADSSAERDAAAARFVETLRDLVPAEPPGRDGAPSVTLTRKLTALLQQQVAQGLLPACLQWLETQGLWRSPDLKDVAAADIKRALSVTLVPSFQHPAARVAAAPFGWFVIVVFGAIAGGVAAELAAWAFALPPDDSGRRAVVSAALAAGLVAALTARAMARPAQRAAFEAAAAAPGFFRRRRAIKAALAETGDGGSSIMPLVFFYLLRPRLLPPGIEDRLLNLQRHLSRELVAATDMVLAFCLTHPDCRGADTAPDVAGGEAPPLSFYEAVGTLDAALAQDPGGDSELREAAEELLQRFRDDGFVWQAAAPDARFDSDLAEAYRPYGLLEEGQPVATRKPALFRHGKLLIRGILSARK